MTGRPKILKADESTPEWSKNGKGQNYSPRTYPRDYSRQVKMADAFVR